MDGENKDGMMWKNMPMHMRRMHMMKFIVLVLLVVLIIVAINSGNKTDANAQNTIVVNGTGMLTVKPDIATVSFSVTDEDLDVSKASDAVNTKIAAIVSALEADGVADADIKTTGYDIEPQYNYTNTALNPYNGTQVLAGYNVTDSIEVKIRDLTKTGKVVTDLGGLGVTNMSGLTFTEDKYTDLVNQAQDMAITDARTQAQALAKSLGVHLDKIVGYSEGGVAPIYPMAMAASASNASVQQAVLPTGENTITSNVSVTYEIN